MSTRIAKSQPGMRKEPRQARSRATVEAIVEAGIRVLSVQGWSGFTTNRVAETAGVSIGSLYQYFPDKQSLVDAIRRRHLDESLAAIQQSSEGPAKPLAAFVEGLVSNVIAAHSINPGLHRVLLDEAPNFDGFRDPNSAFEVEYLGQFKKVVATYCEERPDSLSETMGLIVSDAIDGVIHNAARRGMIQSPEVKKELVRLIRLYLADRA